MSLIWTKKLSIGNAIIDAEHRNLISMVNGVSHEIKIRDGSALSQAFKLLDNWLCVHFVNEDKDCAGDQLPFCSTQAGATTFAEGTSVHEK